MSVLRAGIISLHTSPLTQAGAGDSGGMNVYIREFVSSLTQAGVTCDVFVRRWSDELEAIVDEEVAGAAASGAEGGKAMGMVIKAVRERAGSSADGARIAALFKSKLAG